MQHIKLFSLIGLVALVCSLDAASPVSPYFNIRSQSRDKTRQMVGSVGHTHLSDMESWWGLGSIMVEYTQSFRPNQIARVLFGDDLVNISSTSTTVTNPCPVDCNPSCDRESIRIQGSAVTGRHENAWLADYFYLPTDFSSVISFSPRITNVNIDLNLYVGFDEWLCGLYFAIYGPITHTKWDLNFCESVENAGTNSFAQGYFNPSGISRSNLLANFTSYAQGNGLTSVDEITFTGLQFARIDNCNKTKTGFADLRFELGWDFWQTECYHLGINIQGAAPTGTRVHATRVFSPVVGNGKHWEIGGGLTGHYIFWTNDTEDRSFGFYFDANVTHLFKARQQRTFDLCGKPNSRYMLAEKLGTPIIGNLTASTTSAITNPDATPVTPSAQFQNVFTPVANLTTLDVKVSVGVQADIVAMFNYSSCGFSWDIGYDFWGISCEKISSPVTCDNKCDTISLCSAGQKNVWALKGDARVFGFATDLAGTAIALSATENLATIHSGTSATSTVANATLINGGIDNPAFAYGTAGNLRLTDTPFVANIAANHIRTSLNPMFINCADINLQRTKGISHKVFTHFSYTWERECWIPFAGVGGFAEFGSHDRCCNTSCIPNCNTACNTNCNESSCLNTALSQWGVWVKGGVSFN